VKRIFPGTIAFTQFTRIKEPPVDTMKSVAALFLLASSAAALQSPYLANLNGGARATWAPQPTQQSGGTVAGTTTLSSPSAELLNLWSNQVSVELSASQLYLSASIWFRARDMDGMAAWMLEESGEERGELMKGTMYPHLISYNTMQ
jgi:hypothetical protein